MQTIVKHEKYGEILYKESAWTGKKELWLNGAKINETSKNEYVYFVDSKPVYVKLKGNEMLGVTVTIGSETIRLVNAPKWYEIVLPLFFFSLVMVWGSVPTLCAIIPIVGGAIGGAINGVCLILSMYLMKKQEKVWAKLLIAFGIFVINVIICFVVALIVVSMLYY